MTVFLLIVCLVTAIWLCGGYYVFRRACRREEELDWEHPESLEHTDWAPVAAPIQTADRYLRDHGVQDWFTESFDGLRLHGRFLPAENAVGTIVLFHGYRSNPLGDFFAVIAFYHGLGFNLLLPDQRSHGQSDGTYITFGVRERRDVWTWITCHNDRLGMLPVFLCGMSMGAATVLMAAGQPLPENVRGITADCGFTSPREIIAKVMRDSRVPVFLLPAAELFTRWMAGFGMQECTTPETMAQCQIPVLLIHGTDDHFVPWEMTQRAYDACRSEKQLILVPGAGHGQSYLTDQPRCQSALENFLMEHLN